MSTDVTAAINRLSEVLERLLPIIQQYGETSKDSTSFSEKAQKSNELAMKKEEKIERASSTKSSLVDSSMQAIKDNYIPSFKEVQGGREMASGITSPVEAAYQEIDKFSRKGTILPENTLKRYAGAVAIQQQAAQANMKAFRPMVNEGVSGNIGAKLGEIYTDFEETIGNQGLAGVPKFLKRSYNNIFGSDTFGR